MTGIKLGQSHSYTDKYDANLLEPIPRKLSRTQLSGNTRFIGWDYWNAYELSWLAPNGVPQVAIAEFAFSAASANIVESKSFKYYLNSFNQTVFESRAGVIERLHQDLAFVADGDVKVQLFDLDMGQPSLNTVPGRCIDHIDCDISTYQPKDQMLRLDSTVEVKQAQLYSHLLKSNCPVTGQPDWASVWISYSGSKIDETSLLKYLVGFRQYQGFHESCVERIFSDISLQCKTTELSVYARYTRRGGLDINPYRTSDMSLAGQQPFGRTIRQ